MGPTGAGKSSLACRLAALLDGEVISADSVQVYRGLDRGTAKPDLALRAAIKHHLIDIVDPVENYTAGQFVRDAGQAIDEIRRKGKMAIIAGGTMFYVHALLYGLSQLPEADNRIRAKYLSLAARRGVGALHPILKKMDEDAAAQIHPQDRQRLLRALEVIEQGGAPLSQLQRRPRQGGIKEDSAKRGEQMITCFLLFPNRSVLHQRLALRFQSFIDNGLIDEVRWLKQKPNLSLDCSSIRSVGYRQVWEHLDNLYGYDEMVNRSIAATRQLAKRQLVWLRSWKEPSHSLDATLPAERLTEDVLGLLG